MRVDTQFGQIVTGTGTNTDNGTKYRHARIDGQYRAIYRPDGGGSEAYVWTEGIGWTIDTADEMPHEVLIALLRAMDAPTHPEKIDPESRLMAAYHAACKAPPNVPLQLSLVECQRIGETIGMDDARMTYWAERLESLTAAATAE